MLIPVTHLLDTKNTVPTISPMKNKVSPERKIKLPEHGAEDPRVTTSSSKESDSEYELEFTSNLILHLHQTLPIHSIKIAQKPPNIETHPKKDTTEHKMYPVSQDIANEGGSDHKTNKQDQYVDFNVSELNEKRSSEMFNCNRRVRNFI